MNMFVLERSYLHDMFSLEIDLRNHPHLRFLHFGLNPERSGIYKLHSHVVRWFNRICESITSRSLVIEVAGFSDELEICNMIQDTLLALSTKMESFSVYLSRENEKGGGPLGTGDTRKTFSRLYKAGVVVEKVLTYSEQVSHFIFHSDLPY